MRYRFVGGKGGVGKTTCAAGLAIAEAARGTPTLVVSTDPAPSLADAFRHWLGAAPRPIPMGATARLDAVEIDAARALERWLTRRRASLERAALRGTWLDEEDVARLLRLSLPGIDEIAALLELYRLGQSGRYDLIVVDTAPTGHTLRMFAMPETLQGVARLFDRMQAKHRLVVEALRGRWQPDEDDAVIAGVVEEAAALSGLLRDRSRVAMIWVTLPEPMAVAETVDAARALASQGIGLAEVVVNRLVPPPPRPCRWCAARRRFEAAAVGALRRSLRVRAAAPTLRAVRARDAEPTGIRALAGIGAELRQKGAASFPQKEAAPFRGRHNSATSDVAVGLRRQKGAISFPGTETTPFSSLVMFGGKGGVGKTTCAAAAALAAARAQPERSVRLISTDPAHSLADALGVPLGDTPRCVAGAPRNLEVRELDATVRFAHVRERYRSAIDALFDRLSRGAAIDASRDRQVMRDLIDLTPPGLDELAAVIEVVDALEQRPGDLVILDTAPSGHALRLLEMPSVVQEWTRALMSILLKYQPVVGIGELGPILLQLSQSLGRLRTRLADASATQFVLVTRAAALSRAESARFLRRLSRLDIQPPVVIVNAAGAGDCRRCRRQRAAEAEEVARLRRELRARRLQTAIVVTPAWMPPPHGAAALRAWRRTWQDLS